MNPRKVRLSNPAMSIDSGADRTSGRAPVPHTQRGAGDTDPATPSHDDRINILIVDDEPRNLTVLETILDDGGYRLVRAHTADQALLALVVEEFALLILDIQMPEMTGFELAQMIKSRKKTSQIPIIFLTAYYNEDQHVLAGYDTGAVDYLHKPVNPAILRSKVAVFAELYRRNRECGMANRALLAEVTERRRAQEQLRELNEMLEQRVTERTEALVTTNAALNEAAAVAVRANLAKSEFLSSMSHELRTPLNAILGFAQLIESSTSPPTPDQKRSLDQILKAGWYLLELVNEILDLAQIESGKVVISREAVPLEHVMSECQALVEPLARKRGIDISFPRLDRPHYVDADRTRTRQVLINLLHNSIKYNKPAGMVSMECSLAPPNSIRISIRDTGPGLSPEQLGQLFQPFNRLGRENSGEQGTGIGLVVVKRLVELMGGTVGVDSQLGLGSVFWIELNLTTAPQPTIRDTEQVAQAGSKPPEGAARRTVLYVEDNPANLALVEELLMRRPDLHLISAADGNLGVEYARTYLPEVILMDIHLPGISGIEAMKALRADPMTTHIPVIAISAYASSADIEQAMEAGFFNYLTKPIKLNEFMSALDLALEFSQRESTRTPLTERARPTTTL